MVVYRVVLGKIVSEVALSFVPVVFEMLLGFSILEPEEAHVHCFGSALFDRVAMPIAVLLSPLTWVGGRGTGLET